MNVLWDMRLFSTGYRTRGVGTYCRKVAAAVLESRPDCSLFLWADPAALPADMASGAITVIPYRGGSWKRSVVALPRIVGTHRINLVHYWVALGPISSIGIAPLLPVPSVATIHDLGVALWNTPHSRFLRTTPYWRLQRLFIRTVSAIITNSSATYNDLCATLPIGRKSHLTVYPPMVSPRSGPGATARKPYCIALGGAPHKNLAKTVAAFSKARMSFPDFRLLLLGEITSSEHLPDPLPEGIEREPSMERYEEHLRRASGLLYCSLHEGLGIPPIEAMRHGCPLLLSDIPPLRETCAETAVFVDPGSTDRITEGILSLIGTPDKWARKSGGGSERYESLCRDSATRILALYRQLTGKRKRNRLYLT